MTGKADIIVVSGTPGEALERLGRGDVSLVLQDMNFSRRTTGEEGLELLPEGRVLGSITMQHFFRLYPKLCGMTGTAQPAAEEIKEFYGLDVVVIPANRPRIRIDHPDIVFTDRGA